MMKKNFLCLAVSIILCLCLLFTASACGPKRPPGETGGDYHVIDEDELDKNASLELTISTMAFPHERKIIEELGKGFNKYYPNITIKIDPMSGNTYDTIMSYYRAGRMPDIFMSGAFSVLTLGAAGAILNMDPFIKMSAEKGSFDVSDYYESFWRLGQEKFSGGQWMVPRAADQVVVHYNKLWLQRAGIDLNPATTKVKNGWTWKDFMDVCATVRAYYDNNGMIGRYLADAWLDWEANYNAIFKSFGVEYFGQGETVLINSQETKDALNFIKDLTDKRYVPKFNSAQANFTGGQGVFMLHSTASSLMAEALSQTYKTEIAAGTYTIDDIYDVVTFPLIGETPKVGAGAAGYCIASTCPEWRRDYAWQFLKFLLSAEGQNIISDCGSNYPPMRKDMADPFKEGVSWGKGFEKFNLTAYTWASQPEHNYISPTDFILKRPSRANDLMFEISDMISSYVNFGEAVGTPGSVTKLNNVLRDCEENLFYWAFDA